MVFYSKEGFSVKLQADSLVGQVPFLSFNGDADLDLLAFFDPRT